MGIRCGIGAAEDADGGKADDRCDEIAIPFQRMHGLVNVDGTAIHRDASNTDGRLWLQVHGGAGDELVQQVIAYAEA